MPASTVAAAAAAAVAAIAVVAFVFLRRSSSPLIQVGGKPRLVAFKNLHTSSYLHVAPETGLIVLGANSTASNAARFRLIAVSSASVAPLRLAAERLDRAATAAPWSGRQRVTSAQCVCSGFSNEHGFGRYCHAWELSYQEPWCYVDASCDGAKRGSFGRHHDTCPINPGGLGMDNPNPTFEQPSEPEWVAPAGCPCSRFVNKHGFGGSCKAWEAEHAPWQTPWCYVFDNCTFAKRRGSFGRKHVDCEMKATNHERLFSPSPPPPPPTNAAAAGRRLLDSHAADAAGGRGAGAKGDGRGRARGVRQRMREARSHAHEVEEADLLERLNKLAPKYVAIVSEETQGFVSIGMPPDKFELLAHATSSALSAAAVFALMPDNQLVAVGSTAFLTACDPQDVAPVLCVGYKGRPRDPHRKLLRDVSRLGERAAAARFVIESL